MQTTKTTACIERKENLHALVNGEMKLPDACSVAQIYKFIHKMQKSERRSILQGSDFEFAIADFRF